MNRRTRRIALAAIGGAVALAIAVVLLPSRRPPIAPFERPADARAPNLVAPDQPQSPEGEVLPAGPREPAGPPTGIASRSSLGVDRVPLDVEVVDWDMREVAGAKVNLLVEANRDDGVVDVPASAPNAWETDTHGRSAVSLPERAEGTVYLFAERSGVGTSGKAPPIRDRDTGRVRLVLYPQAHLSGRVLRGAGRPAPDATVEFTHDSELSLRQAGPGRAPRGIKTDSTGRFEIDLDAGHRYRVRASCREAESDWTYVYSDAGSSQELALWLQGALTVKGRLLDPSGSTVPGEPVMAWEQDPAQPLTPGIGTPAAFSRVSTDEEGLFTIPVPRPGTYAVVGFGARFASSLPGLAEVDEGNAHPNLTLSLLPSASIAGRVRREGGAPLANAAIKAVSVRTTGPYVRISEQTGSGFPHATVEVRTGGDGSFSIARLHPLSTYTLLVPWGSEESPLRTVARSVPAGTEGLEIVVPEGTEPEGSIDVVLEPAPPGEGRWRPYVRLWYETGLGDWKKARDAWLPPAANRLRLGGIFPGDRYLLSVWEDDRGTTVVGPWTAKPGKDEMVVHLEPPSTIEVEVTDRDGRPLPFACAYCERVTECEWLKGGRRILTPASGVVRFEQLASGPYQLAAARGTSRSGWTQLEVAGGETRTLTLRLDR